MSPYLIDRPKKSRSNLFAAFLMVAVAGMTLLSSATPASASRDSLREGDFQCRTPNTEFFTIILSANVYEEYGCSFFHAFAEGSSSTTDHQLLHEFEDDVLCSDAPAECDKSEVITGNNVERSEEADNNACVWNIGPTGQDMVSGRCLGLPDDCVPPTVLCHHDADPHD